MSSCKKKKQVSKKTIKNIDYVKKIEKLRNELHELTVIKGKWDTEVVEKSQELDRVLNKYRDNND